MQQFEYLGHFVQPIISLSLCVCQLRDSNRDRVTELIISTQGTMWQDESHMSCHCMVISRNKNRVIVKGLSVSAPQDK
jgi:hypothetical protein